MALTTSVTFAGNVTYDPELRKTSGGQAVVNITVAVNRRTFNQESKQWEDGDPVFLKASAFDKLAEHIAGSVRKGHRVMVHGTMKPNKWNDKESGVERSENTIQIEDIGLSLLWTHAQVVNAPTSGQNTSQHADNSGGGWDSGFGDDTPF